MSLHADFTTLMFYVGLDEIRQQKVRAAGASSSSPASVHVNGGIDGDHFAIGIGNRQPQRVVHAQGVEQAGDRRQRWGGGGERELVGGDGSTVGVGRVPADAHAAVGVGGRLHIGRGAGEHRGGRDGVGLGVGNVPPNLQARNFPPLR